MGALEGLGSRGPWAIEALGHRRLGPSTACAHGPTKPWPPEPLGPRALRPSKPWDLEALGPRGLGAPEALEPPRPWSPRGLGAPEALEPRSPGAPEALEPRGLGAWINGRSGPRGLVPSISR